MADTYLICEGPAHGVDLRVLDMIVAQRLCAGVNVKIVPSGGDSGLNAVRVHHEEKSRRVRTAGKKRGKLGPPDDTAFSIQDRNVRPRAEAEASWQLASNKSFIWRRHEIENYLLAPRVVLEAFNSLRTSPKYVNSPWVANLPVDESGMSSLLMDLARPLLENHAGELLRYELDLSLKRSRAFSIGNPGKSTQSWTKTQWLAHLHQEGQRIQSECAAVTTLPDLAPVAMNQQYDAIFARVADPQFLLRGEFLEEMGGHELMSALVMYLHSLGGRNISANELEEELVKAIGTTYQPGLYNPDDFAELAAKLS